MIRVAAVLLCLVVACPCFAGEGLQVGEPVREECSLPVEVAGRGCCSWHKGQCGCSGGRVVCCDGTLSPTCRCRADGPVSAGRDGALVIKR